MSQPPTDEQTPFEPDPRNLTSLRQWGHDASAVLAEITDHLQRIEQDRLEPSARQHLDAALQQGAILSRIIAGALAQLTGAPDPNDGAGVAVELPYAAMATPDPRPGSASETGQLAGYRILVVDDTDTAPLRVAAALVPRGAEVEILHSGAEALGALERKRYDLVVVDATMPGVSGAQVIRGLRARPGAAGQTPALAMSADASVQRHDELIAAGADRVVIKPLPDAAGLARIAERMIRSDTRAGTPPPQAAPQADPQASAQAAPQTSAPTPAATGEAPLFDPEPLRRVCALAGPEMAEEIAERLIADLIKTQDRLRRASMPPDMAELSAASHVLIALAGTAGAMQLLARTQVLNRRLRTKSLDELGPILAEV